MDDEPTRYWINTISLDHVRLGVEGGNTWAGHGSDTRLRRLRRGDGMAFYSPRTAIRSGVAVQQFTALGVVDDDEPYRVEQPPSVPEEPRDEASRTGRPWRRRLVFEDVTPVPVRPLLPVLGFITDEDRWGLPFRRGLFEIHATDFAAIAGAMRDARDPASDSAGHRVVGAGREALPGYRVQCSSLFT